MHIKHMVEVDRQMMVREWSKAEGGQFSICVAPRMFATRPSC